VREPTPPSAEEAELVDCMRAYQAGSLAAFERLHAAVAGELRRFFAAGARDAGAAQDLVQETLLELHRARRTYLPPLPVRPWVFGIARNVERRHRREVARRRRVLAEEDAAPEPASVPSAVENADLRTALRALPASRRSPWVLHHVHGLSFAEIAGRLGIGAGAAKLRSSRASRALRSFFRAEEPPDE
jgi:RNA polymerase sigma-70 factor (ECF subfamily)